MRSGALDEKYFFFPGDKLDAGITSYVDYQKCDNRGVTLSLDV